MKFHFWRSISQNKGGCGTMARDRSFRCELEKSKDGDENRNQMTIIKCHGELITDTAVKLREAVSPLIPFGGRIIIDLGDVKHVDSSGLGALISLKASALKQGQCTLQLVNLTPGVQELLRVTRLSEMFSS
jgi:anti-anti-sigma factor